MRFLVFSLLTFILLTNTLISALNYQNVPVTVNKIEGSVTTKTAIVIYEAQNDRIHGSEARINLWKPSVKRDVLAYSMAHIRIISKSTTNFEAIEVGWHVYPWLYRYEAGGEDEMTKFFISWTIDSCQTTCYYQFQCEGFALYGGGAIPGSTLDRVSTYDGDQRDMTVRIYKDASSGNWWLKFGGVKVGFWKSEMFTHLNNGGSAVEWGGVVSHKYNRSQDRNTDIRPIPMGSGHFPREGYRKAGYFDQLKILTSVSGSTWAPPDRLKIEVTDPQCYDLQIRDHGIHDNDTVGFYYGGPGGPRCT